MNSKSSLTSAPAYILNLIIEKLIKQAEEHKSKLEYSGITKRLIPEKKGALFLQAQQEK